jgi:hypothetical protein
MLDIAPSKSHWISGLDHRGTQASQNGKGVVGHLTCRRARIRGQRMRP